MTFNRDDPRTWQYCNPLIIAHDVGRSRDRSTAVVGGNCPVPPRLLGFKEFHELPQGLYGSPRASALAQIDRRHGSEALIVVDLSNDPTYAEPLLQTFGPRVIGLHITRRGDGMHSEWRLVKNSGLLVYTIGRSYLLELFHGQVQANLVRLVDDPMTRRACEQLVGLETDIRENDIVYKCPPAQHDDLGMSCAMLAWAAQHPHLSSWVSYKSVLRPPKPRQAPYGWKSFT